MDNKTLVIGSTSQIGASIAKILRNRGDTVVGVSRSVGDECWDDNAKHYNYKFDLSSGVSYLDFHKSTLGHLKFNNLVYVASYHKMQPISIFSDGEIDRHYDINLRAMIDCVRVFTSPNYSVVNKQRSITLICSIAAKTGEPGLIAYSATKGAMISAVRSMAVEFSKKNIRVNSISPGWIESEKSEEMVRQIGLDNYSSIKSRYPLGLGHPEDIAYAVEYLSDPLKARWITGVDMTVDGGRSCS